MMLQRIHGYIAREIQRLTRNEDLRQELWIHILEGNSLFSLEGHLDKLLKEKKRQKNLEKSYGFKTKL
jgi:hypothetical protein